MRRVLPVIVVALLTVLAVHCGAQALDNKIVLRGHGEVKAVPDVGEFTVKIVSRDLPSAARRANDANRKKVDVVRQALAKFGVQRTDIATDFYWAGVVRPENTNPRKQTAPFYKVANSFTVTIRDAKKLGKAVDACTRAGATSVESIYYSFSDPAALQTKATALAVENARARAEQVAKSAGLKIFFVSSVVDQDLYGRASQFDTSFVNGSVFGARREYGFTLSDAVEMRTTNTFAAPGIESITADVVVTFTAHPENPYVAHEK